MEPGTINLEPDSYGPRTSHVLQPPWTLWSPRSRPTASILAAILCGSLSHDTVWAKSDIDLVLVTIDDKLVPQSDVALYADGVNVHAILMPRAAFRRTVEGSLDNSFMRSFLAKGRLLFTHDDTIADLCARLSTIGARDTELQLLSAATSALPPIYKAHKWLITRGDLDYTALWILYAATSLAQDRSAPEQADRRSRGHSTGARAQPGVFQDDLHRPPEHAGRRGLRSRRRFRPWTALSPTARARLFAPVLEYLRDAGEARSASEIDAHFVRHFGIEGVTTACEYLADQGLIGKAATPVRATKKSTVSLQELAFFDLGAGDYEQESQMKP